MITQFFNTESSKCRSRKRPREQSHAVSSACTENKTTRQSPHSVIVQPQRKVLGTHSMEEVCFLAHVLDYLGQKRVADVSATIMRGDKLGRFDGVLHVTPTQRNTRYDPRRFFFFFLPDANNCSVAYDMYAAVRCGNHSTIATPSHHGRHRRRFASFMPLMIFCAFFSSTLTSFTFCTMSSVVFPSHETGTLSLSVVRIVLFS